MGRQKKNELDAILEQLKKSYATDIDNELEDSLLEEEKSEEDAELASVLEKIFESGSNEDTRADDETLSYEQVDEGENSQEDADELVDDIDFSPVPRIVVEKSEEYENIEYSNDDTDSVAAEANEENNEIESNSIEEEKVDDVLNMMLHRNETGDVDEQYVSDTEISLGESLFDELTKDDESTEETVDDESFEKDDDNNVNASTISFTELVADNANQPPEINLCEDESEESLEIPETTSPETVKETDTAFDDGTNDDSHFSENEQYEIVEENVEEILCEEDPEEPFIAEDIQPVKKKVLDPNEYTQDILQHSVSDLSLYKPEEDIDPSLFIEAEVREDEAVANTQEAPRHVAQSEINDNDVSLLMKFGYNGEIASSVGNEYAHAVVVEKNNEYVPEKHRIIHGFTDKEFSSASQIAQISKKYKADKMSLLISSLVLSIIAIAMIVVDILASQSVTHDDYLSLIIFEMVLSLAIAAILHKRLYSGTLGISRFEANPYSMLSIILLEYFLYCVVMSIVHAAASAELQFEVYMAFGGYVSVYAAFTLWAEYFDCCREKNTFDIMSNGETHCVLEKNISALKANASKGRKRKNSAYDIKRTKYVSGYFKRMTDYKTSGIKMVLVAGIIPFIAIVACVVIASTRDSFAMGVNAAAYVLFSATPISAIIFTSVVEYIHSEKLAKSGSAFIGSDSVNEYSKADTIIFNDSDVIEITALTEINPNKSDESSKKWLNLSCNVFEALGGPLANVISSKRVGDSNVIHDLTINSISENGIDVYFDSSMNVLVGDRQYMLSHNIKVKTDTNLSTAVKGVDRTVIYLAFDGVPKIGFIVTSKIKRSFMETVELLDGNKIRAVVQSYEPEINEYYFDANNVHDLLAVHKPEVYERVNTAVITDSGIISKTPKDLCKTVIYSHQIIEDRKAIKLYRVLQSIAGFVIAALIVLAFFKAPDSRFMEFIQTNALFIFYFTALIGMTPSVVRIIQLLRKK